MRDEQRAQGSQQARTFLYVRKHEKDSLSEDITSRMQEQILVFRKNRAIIVPAVAVTL